MTVVELSVVFVALSVVLLGLASSVDVEEIDVVGIGTMAAAGVVETL